MSIVESEKIVVYVAIGDVISMLFSVNLTCDYGRVSENAIFSFPHLDLGLVFKGGAAFFFQKSWGRERPLSLGIVDEVVPANKLKESVLSKAREFAQQPRRSLSGVKRLLNYSLRDLKDYLDFENEILLKIIITS